METITNKEKKVMNKEVVKLFNKVEKKYKRYKWEYFQTREKDLLFKTTNEQYAYNSDYTEKKSIEILEAFCSKSNDSYLREKEKEKSYYLDENKFEKDVFSSILKLVKNEGIELSIELYNFRNKLLDAKHIGSNNLYENKVAFIVFVLKDCNMFYPDFVEESDEKYYYAVAGNGECSDMGFLLLTKKEAAILNHQTNINNWKSVRKEDYSGNFKIDIIHPYNKDININRIKKYEIY